MERLTKTGQPMVWGKGHDGKHWLEPCEMSYRDMGNVLRRLAEYEDTGLEPQEIAALKLYTMGAAVAEIQEFDGVPIARLQELAKAEKKGRLLVLPCEIGETVYRVYADDCGGTPCSDLCERCPQAIWKILPCEFMAAYADDYGKTVFKDEETARNALEKTRARAGAEQEG